MYIRLLRKWCCRGNAQTKRPAPNYNFLARLRLLEYTSMGSIERVSSSCWSGMHAYIRPRDLSTNLRQRTCSRPMNQATPPPSSPSHATASSPFPDFDQAVIVGLTLSSSHQRGIDRRVVRRRRDNASVESLDSRHILERNAHGMPSKPLPNTYQMPQGGG